MSERLGGSVWWKCEQFHPPGAFKLRGAANALLVRTPEERRRGAITYSTGNHGLAVAYMARQLGVSAVICVSQRVPDAKIRALKASGARLIVQGQSQDEAEQLARQLAAQEGFILIPPFDDPAVIAGQGTIGLELLDQVPDVDTVLVPLSGGGLAAGVALALKTQRPSIQVVGISMEGGAVMYESLRQGHPIQLDEVPSLADSLQGGIGLTNQWTFDFIRKWVDETVVISEEAIRRGLQFLAGEGLLVEGAAAVAAGFLLSNPPPINGGTVVGILTGHNLSVREFCAVMATSGTPSSP